MPALTDCLDPPDAYDQLALYYEDIAARRRSYLNSVDSLIISRIPDRSNSLLDVGGGNGRRTLRIAQNTNLKNVVVLEPSRGMSRQIPSDVEVWRIRAEDLSRQALPARDRRFDVITCLWNVLGHIRPEENRLHVLRELKQLLAPTGLLFVDVHHRYNALAYGWLKTIGRFTRDQVAFDEHSGDVTVNWPLENLHCSTYGHVFTDKEVRRLARAAGLEIADMRVVDYETGAERRHRFQGNLFYIFRARTSETESSSATQTSSISASAS